MSAKDLLEYTFDELVDLTTREAHNGLLEGGGQGLKSSIAYHLQLMARWSSNKADNRHSVASVNYRDRIDFLEAENLELKRQLATAGIATEPVAPISLQMTSDDIEYVRMLTAHDGWMDVAREAWNLAIERVCSSGTTFARFASNRALIIYFLNDLKDRLDNEGCNDWELPDCLKPHKAELDLMLKQYSQRDEDEAREDEVEDAPTPGRPIYFDIRVVGALIHSVADFPRYITASTERL